MDPTARGCVRPFFVSAFIPFVKGRRPGDSAPFRTFLAALLSLGLWLFSGAPAAADGFKPVILYQGDYHKNSFIQSVHEGAKAFESKTGLACKEIETGLEMIDYSSRLEAVCKEGYNPVFLLYANHLANVSDIIHRYPATRFVAFGKLIDAPNVFSLDFAEEEGSFLAGALAAMVSKSKVIAFVSVSDLPLMRRFSCGYEQGARFVDPGVKVLVGFIGTYPGSWFDGSAAAKLANGFMDQGADVVYQAAGGAGPAVLEAATKRGLLGIGVDVNQNGLYPGHVLTSMLKRSDKVIYAALVEAQRGIWRDNVKRFGLAQGAIGLAFDENNSALVTDKQRARIDALVTGILSGQIRVHDYVSDNSCQ